MAATNPFFKTNQRPHGCHWRQTCTKIHKRLKLES
jgi:hypothetical protein